MCTRREANTDSGSEPTRPEDDPSSANSLVCRDSVITPQRTERHEAGWTEEDPAGRGALAGQDWCSGWFCLLDLDLDLSPSVRVFARLRVSDRLSLPLPLSASQNLKCDKQRSKEISESEFKVSPPLLLLLLLVSLSSPSPYIYKYISSPPFIVWHKWTFAHFHAPSCCQRCYIAAPAAAVKHGLLCLVSGFCSV